MISRFARSIVLFATLLIVSCAKGPDPRTPTAPRRVEARLVPQLGHTQWVAGATFSPDGSRVLTWSQDGSFGLWDAVSGILLRRVDLVAPALAASFSPDGTSLVATTEQSAHVRDAHTGEARFALAEGDSLVQVAYTPDGRSILGVTDRRNVYVWEAAGDTAGTVRWRVERAGRPHTVALAAGGTQVMLARPGGVVSWHDVATGDTLQELTVSEGTQAALSPDGTQLAVGTRERGTAEIWDVPTGTLTWTLTGHGAPVSTLSFSPDGSRLLSASRNTGERTAVVWNTATGAREHALTTERGSFLSGGFLDDGHVVLGVNEGPVRVWDAATGTLLHDLPELRKYAYTLELSPDGQHLVAGSRDGTAAIWSMSDGSLAHRLEPRLPRALWATQSADGTRLAVASSNGVVTVWDTSLDRPAHHLRVSDKPARTARFSPDGTLLGIGADDGHAGLWDMATGERVRMLDQATRAVRTIDVSPDGTRWLTGRADGMTSLWTDSDSPIATWRPLTAEVRAVRFSPDGTQFATASWDRRLRVYPSVPDDDAEVLEFLTTSSFNNNALQWTPDGTRLFAALGPERAPGPTLWQAETGDVAARVDTGPTLSQVISVAVSHDGRRLATGLATGVVRIYQADSGAMLHELLGHAGVVTSVTFSPDDARLITTSTDGTVRIWDASRGTQHGALMSFGDDGWAVVDMDGRYDASAPDIDALAWEIDGRPYQLSQLRDLYYSPGLAAALISGDHSTLRAVPPLTEVLPPPTVQVDAIDASRVRITVTDQGGGVGTVFVSLNGSDISRDVAQTCPALPRGKPCTVKLEGLPYFALGLPNTLHAWASDGADRVSSRGLDVKMPTTTESSTGPAPELWAVVVGISDYAGTDLDLLYPSYDATEIAGAIALAGTRGFGADKVHLSLLTTAAGTHPITGEPVPRPTFEALEQAFDTLRGGAPTDTLIVYLAGHGVSHRDQDVDDFFYLLPDAGSPSDVSDPAVRDLRSVSGARLQDWLLRSPAARRVVIFDTCESGKAVEQLATVRSALSGDAMRAHARARSRTGAWILAGAAADQVAYEATRYGQGVLTYALLEAFAGPAISEGQVMVGRLFEHAENRVPELARGVGGVQRPFPRRGANDFPLGELSRAELEHIRPADVKPVLVQTDLDFDGQRDREGLSSLVDAALRGVAAKANAPLAFIDAPDFPGSWALTGDYRRNDGGYTVVATLEGTDGDTLIRMPIEIQAADPGGVARALGERIAALLSER